jgi:glycine/D-amino acid oxidase-like deaminating enzyme
MPEPTADVVICGAGIAGITAAYHLTVGQRIKNVILVDERQPMTLTSDKSTECYRNWWPGPDDTMVRFMNYSIDLLEKLAAESNNTFQLNRRGYVFLSATQTGTQSFQAAAEEITGLGAGPLRIHTGQSGEPAYIPAPAVGYQEQAAGADLVLDPEIIHAHYPFITPNARALLHARRCGWLSAQQLGTYLLEKARAQGMKFINGRVTNVDVQKGRVQAVKIAAPTGSLRIQTRNIVLAPGPFLKHAGEMVGVELPVYNELHAKAAIKDPLQIVPRNVPLMIWSDPVHLPWSAAERAELAASPETRGLLERFPAGVHFRPEGGRGSPILLAIWTYEVKAQEPVWPPSFEPAYAEIVLRGLTAMVPRLSVYLDRMSAPILDGGYYCKTRENRPLIGPLPVDGAYVHGALSGFGIMSGLAGGELLAAHIAGTRLPDYAPEFLLSRYDDPAYQRRLAAWESTTGQL